MVINYKRLNDNTFDDAYKIPNKDSLINSIQGCRYFSQLDCKSGFWQIRLDEDSKPWTAFSCPCGLYEWNVMPFGLKNAPQIFQRMMDRIFGKYSFILVYIDDILVFSKTLPEHIKHLELVFEELINNGLIVSRKKIKLFKNQIEFLGLELENGQVKLQEHIVQKINNFPDKLEDLKTLQSFLGLLNYARPYIKNLSQLAGPLYSKTKITGQKYFNQEDIKLVQKIKELVKNLPTLHLPLESEYKIIQTDASQIGWGGILLALTNNLEEKLCRYCSGTFSDYQKNLSSTDLEIEAIILVLEKFQLFLNQEQFTLRTDCENIKKFFENKNSSKLSTKRWIKFQNALIGFKPKFEHIKGKDNILADWLSRQIYIND